MISQAAQDWTDNPVIISTESVAAPMKDVPFPSLTVCRKNRKSYKNWHVPELIFNFIDIQKKDEKVQELFAGFSDFTKKATQACLKVSNYDNYYQIDIDGVKLYLHDVYCKLAIEIQERWDWYPNDEYLEILRSKFAVAASRLEILTIDQLLEDFNFKKGTTPGKNDKSWTFYTFQVNLFQTYLDFCGEDIYDIIHEDIWSFIDRAYHFNLEAIYSNFGTTLRTMEQFGELSVYHQPYNHYVGDVEDLCTSFDSVKFIQMFHTLLKQVGVSFNSKISLYDIPKMFNPYIPLKPPSKANYHHNHVNLPTYTLCEIGPESFIPYLSEDLCRSVWINLTESYGEADKLNPYLINMKEIAKCGEGLKNQIK